jgi:hypothetical protein
MVLCGPTLSWFHHLKSRPDVPLERHLFQLESWKYRNSLETGEWTAFFRRLSMSLSKAAELSSPPGIAFAAKCIEKESARAQLHSGLSRLQQSWSYDMAQSAMTERASLPQDFIRLHEIAQRSERTTRIEKRSSGIWQSLLSVPLRCCKYFATVPASASVWFNNQFTLLSGGGGFKFVLQLMFSIHVLFILLALFINC